MTCGSRSSRAPPELFGASAITVQPLRRSPPPSVCRRGICTIIFPAKKRFCSPATSCSLDRLLVLLDDVERSSDPPDQKLRCLIVAFVHAILDEFPGTALGLELEALSPSHLRAVIARRDQVDQGLRRVIDQGIRTGQFDPANVKFLSFAILGAINWIPR